MKLIIDIPDEDYKFIKELQFYHSGRRSGRTIERNVINGIKNGIPYEERPQGEWVKEDEVHSKCSLCGFKYADYRILFDYCPNCGADMRKEAENEDSN